MVHKNIAIKTILNQTDPEAPYMPLVSIVVPVYNVETFLPRCIDSILSQSFSDFELILVDDGSPDSCGIICDQFAAKDSRIHVIHQQNRGVAAARNIALDWAFEHSDSDWLTFIDSDDIVHPLYIETLLNAAGKFHVSIGCCHFVEVPQDQICAYHFPEIKIPDATLVDPGEVYSNCPWRKIFRKECFYDLRFPVGKIHEDAYVMYKPFFNFKYVAFVDAPLYCYNIDLSGITHSPWYPKRLEEFPAHEEQINFFIERRMNKQFCKTVRIYLYAIIGQLKDIQNNKDSIPKYNHYLRLVRNKMRKVIRVHKKQADLTIKKYPQFYEYAYPNFMKIYWILKYMSKKLLS